MFGKVGMMRVITIHNVNFLIDHYGEDGWGMPNYMPSNYTIPHTAEEMEETHGSWTFEIRQWTQNLGKYDIPNWLNYKCESKFVSYGWYEWARCQF